MTAQPEALRLADSLEISSNHGMRREAAAEMRRLHAENEALQNTKHYEAPRGFVLNPDYLVPELRAQRDALLEALRLLNIECHQLHHNFKDRHDFVDPCPVVARINAAIKAAEGGRHD